MYFIYMALAAAAAVVRNLLAKAEDIRDAGLISVSGRSPGGGLGNLLQYSCLENLMDGGAMGLQSWTCLK